MLIGSGYRGTIDQLDDNARALVRGESLDFIRENDTRSVEANVIYGHAVK
jgi:hypothetical protein